MLTAGAGSGNAGTLEYNSSNSVFADAGTFTNSGTFVDALRVQFTDVVNQARAMILVKPGATFAASGSVTNAGQVVLASSDTLAVGGAYIQKPTGTLQLAVAGTAPGSTYAQLAVKGRAVLGGVLRITRAPTYTASAGRHPPARYRSGDCRAVSPGTCRRGGARSRVQGHL